MAKSQNDLNKLKGDFKNSILRPLRLSSMSKNTLLNSAIVVLLLIIYAIGIFWGQPSEITAAVDSPVPLSPLVFVSQYSNPNVAYKYPAVHKIVLLPLYTIVFLIGLKGNLTALSSSWPYGLTNPLEVFSTLIVVSRLISVIMAVGILFVLVRISRKNPGAGWWSAALLGAGASFTFYARVANVDIPYMFWWMLSYLCLWQYIVDRDFRPRQLLLSAIFASLSIGTKDQAAGLIAGHGLAILILGGEEARDWPLRMKRATLFSCTLLVSYAFVAVLPQPARWYQHVLYWRLSSPSVGNYVQVQSNLNGYGALLVNAFKDLLPSLSLPVIPLVVIGLASFIRRRQYRILVLLLLPIFTYFGIVIFPIRFVYARFMLPAAILLSILAGNGAAALLRYLRLHTKLGSVVGYTVVTLILAYQCLVGYLSVTQIQLADTKRVLSNEIDQYVPDGSNILWIGKRWDTPNAGVYQRYNLMVPLGEVTGSSFFDHIFAPYDPDVRFVLSDEPIEDEQLTLIASWTFVPVPRSLSYVSTQLPLNRPFFLYVRDSANS